jgi:hypothetical protein
MAARHSRSSWAIGLAAAMAVVLMAVTVQAQMPKPPSTSKPVAPAARPLTDAERKSWEDLQAAQRQFDTDSGRVMAGSPDGRRRVPEAIAKQFGVADKVVTDLRARRISYGEVTIALALSQQMMRRDKLTQQQALDRVLAPRSAGRSWGVVARDLGLKIGDVVSDVRKADGQLPKSTVVPRAAAPRPAASPRH